MTVLSVIFHCNFLPTTNFMAKDMFCCQVGRMDCVVLIEYDSESNEVTDEISEYLSGVVDVTDYYQSLGILKRVWHSLVVNNMHVFMFSCSSLGVKASTSTSMISSVPSCIWSFFICSVISPFTNSIFKVASKMSGSLKSTGNPPLTVRLNPLAQKSRQYHFWPNASTHFETFCYVFFRLLEFQIQRFCLKTSLKPLKVLLVHCLVNNRSLYGRLAQWHQNFKLKCPITADEIICQLAALSVSMVSTPHLLGNRLVVNIRCCAYWSLSVWAVEFMLTKYVADVIW